MGEGTAERLSRWRQGLSWHIPNSHRWLGDELTVVVAVAAAAEDDAAAVVAAAGRTVGSVEASAVAYPWPFGD